MKIGAYLGDNDGTISVQNPLRLRQRCGRKLMIAPDSMSAWIPPRSRVDSGMVKVIARARRRQRMLETGVHATVTDLAVAEKINQSASQAACTRTAGSRLDRGASSIASHWQ